MALGPISVSGGAQYEIRLAYWHANGKWFLYMNGTAGSNCIGYYNNTQYKGGALWKKRHAALITAEKSSAPRRFPGHGQRRVCGSRLAEAAYQQNIGYWQPLGGTMINAEPDAVAVMAKVLHRPGQPLRFAVA